MAKRQRRQKTKWDRFFKAQMQDPRLRALVEKELAELRVGVQIATLRQKQGWSQTQLAARVGSSSPDISRLEAGKANPTLRTLAKVAAALGAKVKVQLVEEARS